MGFLETYFVELSAWAGESQDEKMIFFPDAVAAIPICEKKHKVVQGADSSV